MARLATVAPSGGPHLVPIVFARCGGHLWTPVDGKPKRAGAGSRELARVRNARARGEVGLLLDHYDEDWRRLWWLRVEGRATVIEGRDPAVDPELARVAGALRAKYPQYARVPLFRGDPLLLRIAIDRIRSWCAGPEALRAASAAAGAARPG